MSDRIERRRSTWRPPKAQRWWLDGLPAEIKSCWTEFLAREGRRRECHLVTTELSDWSKAITILEWTRGPLRKFNSTFVEPNDRNFSSHASESHPCWMGARFGGRADTDMARNRNSIHGSISHRHGAPCTPHRRKGGIIVC